MKSSKTKKIGLTALMTLSFASLRAADGNGVIMNDTMVFAFFVFSAIIFLMIIYSQINALKGILENRDIWNESGSKSGAGKAAGILVIGLLAGQGLYAQEAAPQPLVVMTDQMYWILLSINAFLLGIIITLYFVTKGLIRSFSGEEEEQDVMTSITASLTDAVPIEREGEVMLDHDYDGIRELDNNLPPWWKYGFYFTIVFAVIYLIRYHIVGSGKLQLQEYEESMAEASLQMEALKAEQANTVDESNLVILDDPARLEAGKAIYVGNCQVCHNPNLEGNVGPNLTDEYWLHGGGIKNVYSTIKNGVPEKGMISWEGQLTPGQIHEVASFILSKQGSNPPNAKPPQGEKWVGEGMASESATSAAESTAAETDSTATGI